MSSPRRYTDGVTNIAKGKALAEMPMLDPSKVYGIFEDFFLFRAGDWELSETGAGTEVVSGTLTGGVLVLTCAGGANDFDFAQYSLDTGTTPSTAFLFATGKKAWFKARLKVDDVTSNASLWTAGLYIDNDDPGNAHSADGVWFQSDAATNDVDLIIAKNASETTAAGAFTCTDATFLTLGFYWDGVNTIHYFKDDVEVGSVGVGTSLPDDATVALSFGIEAGEAQANAMYIDYIGCWMER